MGSEVVRGGNLQAAIVAIASRYNARPERRIDPGLCRCAGGTGNCLGCDTKPMTTRLHRTPGQPGKAGRDGLKRIRPLVSGLPGSPGHMTISVRASDGTITQYDAPWKLRLLSFDIEDENGDGIFEPGEHVVVRRICVQNMGKPLVVVRPAPS